MIKEGGVRKTSVSRKFLKKHIQELEETGFVYSINVDDPIRKIRYAYYTLRPKCDDPKQLRPKCFGVPKHVNDNLTTYRKMLSNYYMNVIFTFFGKNLRKYEKKNLTNIISTGFGVLRKMSWKKWGFR